MKKFIQILILIGISTQLSMAQIYKNDSNIALNGYDPVAYSQLYEARRGIAQHSLEYQGTLYYFMSQEHLDLFKKQPENYTPQFGGYCAFAMAMKGELVPSDPNTFKFHNGKLYLFFNDYYQGAPFNTIIPWIQNEASLVDQASKNWDQQ